MSWFIKYLGVKALKAMAKKFILKTWIFPGINKTGNWVQKYVDDPDTDADEKFVQEYKNFVKYRVKKFMDKI